MSANSSSTANDSLPLPDTSSSNSFVPLFMHCFISRPGSFVFLTFSMVNVLLLLPLCILVLHLVLQRWPQQRSTSTAAMMSHSDSFTYHMVIMELVCVFGCVLCCCGIYRVHVLTVLVGYCLFTFTWYGEMFFHSLTCLDCYLAVVHPIIYLSLKGERGVGIRNISIGCVWLLSCGATSLTTFNTVSSFVNFCTCISSLIIISFCSLSVLGVLIRPGPGEQGGDRERVDQSKQRAFCTIVSILGMLLLSLVWSLVWLVLYITRQSGNCVTLVSALWFNLPCSLVLPLLFLHRAGRLVCCKNNTKWR